MDEFERKRFQKSITGDELIHKHLFPVYVLRTAVFYGEIIPFQRGSVDINNNYPNNNTIEINAFYDAMYESNAELADHYVKQFYFSLIEITALVKSYKIDSFRWDGLIRPLDDFFRADVWRNWEALALLETDNPDLFRLLNSDQNGEFDAGKYLSKYYELLNTAIEITGDLEVINKKNTIFIKPKEFVKWCVKKKIDVPEYLQGLIDNGSTQSVLKSDHERKAQLLAQKYCKDSEEPVKKEDLYTYLLTHSEIGADNLSRRAFEKIWNDLPPNFRCGPGRPRKNP